MVRLALVIAVLFTACGDDDAAMDAAAGTDGGGDGSAGGIAAPAPPEPVVLGAGPFGGGEAMDCGVGQAHFPSEAGCVPVGAPCPAGDFPETAPPSDGRVLYVLAGASGGDGSRTAPYGTIGEAMTRTAAGATLVVGKGTYDEVVRLRAGVTLHGTCVAETHLTSTTFADMEGVITVSGTDTAVRNVTIGPAARPGVWVRGTGVELDGVRVERVQRGALVIVSLGTITGRDVVVRDTQSDGSFGWGLALQDRAAADLERVVVERSYDLGVFPQGSSMVTLRDAVIRDTVMQDLIERGRGINVQVDTTVTLEGAVIEGNHEVGLFATGATTAVALRDVVLTDTAQNAFGNLGMGIEVSEGASLLAERTRLARNVGEAIFSDGASSIELRDVTATDTASSGDRESDIDAGLFLQAIPEVSIQRLDIARSRGHGVLAIGPGALDATDLVVRDTAGRALDGLFGRGFEAFDGLTANLSRVVVEGNQDAGVAYGRASRGTLEDVVVRGTRSVETPVAEYDGRWGRGVTAQIDTHLVVRRAVIEGNHELGLNTWVNSSIDLEDVVVRDTRARACADSTCVDRPFGSGIGVYGDSTLTATRFEVIGSPLCGIHLAPDPANGLPNAEADLSDGVVADNTIGACVGVDGYDLDRLTAGVRYRDNGEALQTIDLPIPGGSLAGAMAP